MNISDSRELITHAFQAFKKMNLDNVDQIICDHICYRVESLERYEAEKAYLSTISTLRSEAIVSKRPIAIYELHEPIVYDGYEIKCIELPAPKAGSKYAEGWEHAEFVVKDLDTFIKNNSGQDFNTKAMGRDINPELGLKIDNGFSLKFHPLHILDVIIEEEKRGIHAVD